jgi:hypothetical protein
LAGKMVAGKMAGWKDGWLAQARLGPADSVDEK